MNISIGYVNSSRKQICRKCGKTIPARAQSVKTTKTWRGRVSLTESAYTCLECEKRGEHS